VERINLSGRDIPILIQYKKIRHTYLRIKPDQSLFVTTSLLTKESTIIDFIKIHEQQILKTLDTINHTKKPLAGSTIDFFGATYPIVYNPLIKKNYLFSNGIFYYLNEQKKINSLKKFYANEVVEKSKQLLEKWKMIIGNSINLDQVSFKSQWMKSQFGSCQSKTKIINLNSVLACFDEQYLEAILLHELVHLKIQNHGKKFYDLLLFYIPNYRLIRHELGVKFKSIGG